MRQWGATDPETLVPRPAANEELFARVSPTLHRDISNFSGPLHLRGTESAAEEFEV
jgi:hypothetical protein